MWDAREDTGLSKGFGALWEWETPGDERFWGSFGRRAWDFSCQATTDKHMSPHMSPGLISAW